MKISIIVPIYNVEQYLDLCVQSIQNQSITDFELILIDDGAMDYSSKMCDEYARIDKRIIVIHKRNGGQADSRNVGISFSAGKFIGFVDSDDVIYPQMYESLLRLLQNNDAEASECGLELFDKWPHEFFLQDDGEVHIFNGVDIVKACLDNTYITQTVPNMLVKADIAKEIAFDTGKIHEDILWPFRVLKKCTRMVVTTQKLYAYYQRPGSTMHSGYSKRKFDALDAFEIRAKEVKDEFPQFYAKAEEVYLESCIYHCQIICGMRLTSQHYQYIKTIHRRFRRGDLKSVFPNLNLQYKIWYSMFYVAPILTCKIRNKLQEVVNKKRSV